MKRRGWILVLLAGAVAMAAYQPAGEITRSVLYDVLAAVAAGACLVAARGAVGTRRASWALLAAGTGCFLLGDILFSFWEQFPSVADVAYLSGYPLLAAGMALLVPRSRASTIGATLDAALVTTIAGLFLFLFWLEPLVRGSSDSDLGKVVSCAYPLGDLLLLALVMLALLRVPAPWFLMSSMAALLATDLVYTGLLAHNSYDGSSAIDIGWLASYTLLGTAALHPSARAVPEGRQDTTSWRRLSLVGLCLFAVAVAGIPQVLGEHSHVDDGALVVFGVVIAALACGRLASIARERSRSERHFRALIESTNDIVGIVGPDGAVRYVSPSVEHVLGLPSSLYGGRTGVGIVHPDDLPRLQRTIGEAFAGDFEETTCRVADAQGAERTFVITGRLLTQGPFAGSLLVNARDITRNIAVEAKLRAKEEELRQAQKLEAVGQLAGGVAHDFNNLLTAISGYTEMARDHAAELGAPQLEADLAEVLAASKRAAALVQQLLAFSRRQRLETRPLELNDTLRELDRLLRRVIGEHIELVTFLLDEQVWVEADRSQLEQVVLNLAVNARDAMPNGGTLTLAVSADEQSATLTVRDDGAGMDDETRRRAFEPFFTTKEVGKGTGLGLATVYGIVTLSGGSIDVDSAPGAGASFTVSLPRIAPPVAGESEADGRLSSNGGRILLVEDEQQVRFVAARMLRDAGYEVLEAGEGEQALRVLRSEGLDIDLLLTDVVMPRLSGPELAAQARELCPRLEVLFFSGYASEELRRPGDLAHAHFLSKPFTMSQLVGAVDTAIADARAASC